MWRILNASLPLPQKTGPGFRMFMGHTRCRCNAVHDRNGVKSQSIHPRLLVNQLRDARDRHAFVNDFVAVECMPTCLNENSMTALRGELCVGTELDISPKTFLDSQIRYTDWDGTQRC